MIENLSGDACKMRMTYLLKNSALTFALINSHDSMSGATSSPAHFVNVFPLSSNTSPSFMHVKMRSSFIYAFINNDMGLFQFNFISNAEYQRGSCSVFIIFIASDFVMFLGFFGSSFFGTALEQIRSKFAHQI